MDRKSKILLTAGACCLLVFCVSAYEAASQLARERREARAFEELIARIEPESPDTGGPAAPAAAPTGDDAMDKDISGDDTAGDVDAPAIAEPSPEEPPAGEFHKYDALYEQNHDLFGWVSIDGTELNYPVMHTPEDPERYIHRAFDGTSSASGVPFLDGNCFAGCGNYIVYGHHMKNGSMFATLPEYADEAYWEEHPTVRFDTLDSAGEYEVMAAFYAKVYSAGDEDVFRYYSYADLTDEETFMEYVSQVYDASLYDTGVTARFGDQLLTLTTCSYHTSDGRFVVVARKAAQ